MHVMTKHPWAQGFGVCWLVISVWPVLKFYRPGPLLHYPDLVPTVSPHYRDVLIAKRNVDHFADYRQSPQCGFSSLSLHKPSYPLCPEKDTQTLLNAMSGGGRIGLDAPYMPLGCDMQWFTTEQICDIMSRFERISILGDSLMRDIAIAFHVFLRKDLIHGAQQDWLSSPEGLDCSCESPWNIKACNWYITINSDQLYPDHADLMVCPQATTAFVKYHVLTAYPIPDFMLDGYLESAFKEKPKKPHAVIMGAGLWNDLGHNETQGWIDQVVNRTLDVSPWLEDPNQMNPRLFLTPNAAHAAKNPKHWAKQGNIPISVFENALGSYAKNVHGIDHLGTFNMSIQATSYDGTHAGMRVNLLKVMAIFNWLNSLDVSRW